MTTKKKFQAQEIVKGTLNYFINKNNSEKKRDWELAHIWIDEDGHFVRGEIIDHFHGDKEITPADVLLLDEEGNELWK